MNEKINTILGKIASYSLDDLKVKEVASDGTTARVISGLANAYIEDRSKEIVDPGAFMSSLDAYLTKNPIVFYNHEWDEPIGKVRQARISGAGLFVEIEIGRDFEPADTVWKAISQGILRSFSIGFRPIVVEYNEDTDQLLIKDLELYEVSVVTIPMNTDSLFEMGTMGLSKVKCLNKTEVITYKSLIESLDKTSKETPTKDLEKEAETDINQVDEDAQLGTLQSAVDSLNTILEQKEAEVISLQTQLAEQDQIVNELDQIIGEFDTRRTRQSKQYENLFLTYKELENKYLILKTKKLLEDSGVFDYIKKNML